MRMTKEKSCHDAGLFFSREWSFVRGAIKKCRRLMAHEHCVSLCRALVRGTHDRLDDFSENVMLPTKFIPKFVVTFFVVIFWTVKFVV
jgi:hypothetical protein